MLSLVLFQQCFDYTFQIKLCWMPNRLNDPFSIHDDLGRYPLNLKHFGNIAIKVRPSIKALKLVPVPLVDPLLRLFFVRVQRYQHCLYLVLPLAVVGQQLLALLQRSIARPTPCRSYVYYSDFPVFHVYFHFVFAAAFIHIEVGQLLAWLGPSF